jgi:hypothetical protein
LVGTIQVHVLVLLVHQPRLVQDILVVRTVAGMFAALTAEIAPYQGKSVPAGLTIPDNATTPALLVLIVHQRQQHVFTAIIIIIIAIISIQVPEFVFLTSRRRRPFVHVQRGRSVILHPCPKLAHFRVVHALEP